MHVERLGGGMMMSGDRAGCFEICFLLGPITKERDCDAIVGIQCTEFGTS